MVRAELFGSFFGQQRELWGCAEGRTAVLLTPVLYPAIYLRPTAEASHATRRPEGGSVLPTVDASGARAKKTSAHGQNGPIRGNG